MIESYPRTVEQRPAPSLGGRLLAVAFLWAAAAALVLGTAAFTRIGPVIYVIDARHGVHAFDALVAAAAFAVAVLLTPALLRRPAGTSRRRAAADVALPVPPPYGWPAPAVPPPYGWPAPVPPPGWPVAAPVRSGRPVAVSAPPVPRGGRLPAGTVRLPAPHPRPGGPDAPTVAFASAGRSR